MRGKLPDAILNRRKAGLDIPAHEWFRGPLLPFAAGYADPGSDPEYIPVRCGCDANRSSAIIEISASMPVIIYGV